jgi:hypothetical protein
MWMSLRTIMKKFLHLPMVGASLEGMSTRVARWFFESPDPTGTRFDLIRRQAREFAETFRCDPWAQGKVWENAIQREWDQVKTDMLEKYKRNDEQKAATEWDKRWGTTPYERWKNLEKRLGELDPSTLSEVRAMVFPIVLAYWKTLSIEEAFGDVGSAPRPTPESAGKVHGPSATMITTASTGQSVLQLASKDCLSEWASKAVDFLSLLLVSWLAVAMAQIWRRISCLVIVALALLLAISSYPFPYQDRLLFSLGVLIISLAVIVIQVVLGVNREEVISRIANAPHGLKLDSQLVSSLLSYVLPLVGILAALSFNISDTFHTFLDPITRYFR